MKNNFRGATDTPVLDFWGLKPARVALFILGRGICVIHYPRFTSGAKSAALLSASMAAELFSCTYLQVGIGEARKRDLSCDCWGRCSVDWAKAARVMKSNIVFLSTITANLYFVKKLCALISSCQTKNAVLRVNAGSFFATCTLGNFELLKSSNRVFVFVVI